LATSNQHDQLLAELEEAIAESRDVVDRLERAYMILCQSDIRPAGRLIPLDRDRRISDLADESRSA
jgi:hypothetical protein